MAGKNQLDLNEQRDNLIAEIEFFVEQFLGNGLFHFTGDKIINDAIWGTHNFQNYELEIISTPLFQRLRQIRQMGFVNYIYPSATHSRFDHSLGTTIIADKLFNAAKKHGPSNLLDSDLYRDIRIAALLHDIGHCLFSHSSETLYGPMLEDLIDCSFDGNGVSPKPHEYLSYLIVKSDGFKQFFKKISNHYHIGTINQDLIADIIIGKSEPLQRYKTSMINGTFDADKIDYIYRDSKFSGIPLLIDIDRLTNEIFISDINKDIDSITLENVRDLTIGFAGVTCLEQIIFNKMLLFSNVYHHQKVLAFDCMFKSFFKYFRQQNTKPLKFRNRELDFNKVTDFLWLTDFDFFAEGNRHDGEIHDLIHDLLYRRCLKRVAVINNNTTEQGIGELTSIDMDQLVDNICLEAKLPESERHKVWLSTPKNPTFMEATSTYILESKTDDKTLTPLVDFFPTAQWATLYRENKYKAYLFCPGEHIEKLAPIAYNQLKSEGIILKKNAFTQCKVTPPNNCKN